MGDVMRDLDPESLVHAIEANGAEFLLVLGRAGGGEERDDGEIQWTIGGSPIDYHNAVVRADLPPSAADGAIRASINRMRVRGVPGTWHVGPSMRPADLPQRLMEHGFVCGGHDIGMAVDLRELPDRAPAPSALSIVRVDDGEALGAWAATLASGFGEGEREARWVGAMYARIGLEDDRWHHYLGLVDGDPVATASLFVGAGAAGIYFVFTVPEARCKGIGGAITLAALRRARDLGLRVGVLAMGYSVYRQLGFREHCQIGVYEWRPSSTAVP